MDAASGQSKDDNGTPSSADKLIHAENQNVAIEVGLKDIRFQIIASCISALTVVQVGLNMSYSAVLLPQLEDSSSGYNLSKNEESWIASLLVLSTPIGSLLSGPISDKIGRKGGNLLTCVPVFVAWCLIGLSSQDSLGRLYAARILAGLGGGLTTVFIVYVSEICHEKYRPMLLGLNSMAVSLGVLIVMSCGVWLDWKQMAISYAILALVTFILIGFFTPESPYWSAIISNKSNRISEAEKSLKWLHTNDMIYQKTLQQILSSGSKSEDDRRIKNNFFVTFSKNSKQLLVMFLLRGTFMPVLILMGLILLQQLSGGYSIIFYTVQIFKKLGGSFGGGINEYHASVFMGIIRFIVSILSAGLSRAIGRRPLLFISSLGMAVSCFCLSIYQIYYLPGNFNQEESLLVGANFSSVIGNETNILNTNHEITSHWFPMICILIFVSMSAIGLLNIPWTMMGELLPTSTRGVGTGFLISFAYVIMFITVKIYPFLLDSFDIGFLFLVQGILCLVTILYTYIFVPETLGKSLNEIEKYFSRQR